MGLLHNVGEPEHSSGWFSDLVEAPQSALNAPKNSLDLWWNLRFVDANIAQYESVCRNILVAPQTELSPTLELSWMEIAPQIAHELPPDIIAKIWEIIPQHLRNISNLRYIQYRDLVALWDEKWVSKIVQFAEFREAPEGLGFFIGVTTWDGTGISLIPVPPPCLAQIHEEEKMRVSRCYHIHVFLHEFFHTLINVASSDDPNSSENDWSKRAAVRDQKKIRIVAGREASLQDWYEDYVARCITPFLGHPAGPWIPSHYAAHYKKDLLNPASPKFDLAVMEHMCETFVAHMLDIVPNTEGWTSFRSEQSSQPALRAMANLCMNNDHFEPYEINALAVALSQVKIHFTEIRSVLYPACDRDSTVLSAFPDAPCTLVDPDIHAKSILSPLLKDGDLFIDTTLQESNLHKGSFDLAVLVNSNGWITTDTISYVKPGGIILAQGNDWNFDAAELIWDESLILKNVITGTEVGEYCLEDGDLAPYLSRTGTSETGHPTFQKEASWYIFQKK